MPGAMHRMGVYLGLVEDDEYADADGYGQSAERVPARRDDYADALEAFLRALRVKRLMTPPARTDC